MAKQRLQNRRKGTVDATVVRGATGNRASKVKFGNVVVSSAKPSAAAVKANVERSTQALERVTKKIGKPGVVLRAKRDVPQFSVDEHEPGIFLRLLNGRMERGRLVNGSFVVID